VKSKGLVILLTVVLFIAGISDVAGAASWKYVGKMDFASGKSWTAYVDTSSVYDNTQAGTVVYTVLFEYKGKNVSLKKLVKYETRRDNESTRWLEFHAYYMDNSLMTESNTPQTKWQGVDEETLLRGALDVVYDVLAGKR